MSTVPILYLDPVHASATYEALAAELAPIRVRYAAKANPHPALLAALDGAKAQFAIASSTELEALAALGVPGAHIACVNPGPTASLLHRCRALGVHEYSVDSVWELRKLAALVPGATACVALQLPSAGRLRYPAARVGLPLADLEALLAVAREVPVGLAGVAVHVGSQCERLAPWRGAVALAGQAWRRLAAAGWQPHVLNLGGGLPAPYRPALPRSTAIARVLRAALDAHFDAWPDQVWLEPGRYLAAGSGVLATTIVARSEAGRGRAPRLTLDVGRYYGLPEAALGIRYPYAVAACGRSGEADSAPPLQVLTPRTPGARRHVLVGPMGGTRDVLDRAAWLPPLDVGDRLYLLQAGAYTAVQAAHPSPSRGVEVAVVASPSSHVMC